MRHIMYIVIKKARLDDPMKVFTTICCARVRVFSLMIRDHAAQKPSEFIRKGGLRKQTLSLVIKTF